MREIKKKRERERNGKEDTRQKMERTFGYASSLRPVRGTLARRIIDVKQSLFRLTLAVLTKNWKKKTKETYIRVS